MLFALMFVGAAEASGNYPTEVEAALAMPCVPTCMPTVSALKCTIRHRLTSSPPSASSASAPAACPSLRISPAAFFPCRSIPN